MFTILLCFSRVNTHKYLAYSPYTDVYKIDRYVYFYLSAWTDQRKNRSILLLQSSRLHTTHKAVYLAPATHAYQSFISTLWLPLL